MRGSVNNGMRWLFDCCVTMLTDCNIECLPRSVQILRDMVVTERSEREGETRPGVRTSGKARHTPQTNLLCLEIYLVWCLELLLFMAFPRYLCSKRWLVDGDDANVNNVFYLLVNNVLAGSRDHHSSLSARVTPGARTRHNMMWYVFNDHLAVGG